MKYGPYICIAIVLFILFVLWAFWGGKNYEFVGLAPLDPSTCGSYTGSLYNWGTITPAVESTGIALDVTSNPSGILLACEQENPTTINSQEIIEQTHLQLNSSNSETTHVSYDNTPYIPPEFQLSSEIPPNTCPNSDPVHIQNAEISIIGLPVILDTKPEQPIQRSRSTQLMNLPQPRNPIGPPVKPRAGRFISRGERICCQTMEQIYGVPFKSLRPDWLINPETGEKLELDCYNEELKIAVEYNGEQHYTWPNFTNQTYQQFINQVRRDELKVKLCDRNGIYLIVVPHNVSLDKIPEFITSYLPETIQKRLQEEHILSNIRTM